MKFLHISDLHIGKRLHEVSLLEDQAYILDKLLQIVDDTAPDGVLIAGDVYDKSIPSAEAVSLFDDFLVRLAKKNTAIFIISGNHDSPERLAFGGRLLESRGIHLSPVYNGTLTPISLQDGWGTVNVWLLPFLKPAHVRRFREEPIESYTDALRLALDGVSFAPGTRNVLVTHQFVTGAETCESEELSVGGSDNVDASVFDGFDYVALGHIHGPQNIGSSRIRYCGTPLKYSFSEADHCKSVTLVHLEDALRLETIPLQPLRELRQLKGTFAQLTDPDFYNGQARTDYLHICLTDEQDVPEAVGQLRQIYPNLLRLSYDNTRTRTDRVVEGPENLKRKSPLELFEDLYTQQNNQPMSQEQRAFALELIESIWEGGK